MASFLESVRASLLRWRGEETRVRTLHGIRVVVHNTRPDISTDAVLARIDGALGMLEQYAPSHLRRMRRDFAEIISQRFACRGAYFPAERRCLVELTFTVNPEFTLAQVASVILHEAMHARIHAMGIRTERVTRAREERFCRRAEIEFGRVAPGGEPVVERALGAIAMEDEEVAPEVDWALAQRRIAEVDEAARRGDQAREN